MNELIEERARLVRMLAYKADPFTKVRLVKLAEKYDVSVVVNWSMSLGNSPFYWFVRERCDIIVGSFRID